MQYNGRAVLRYDKRLYFDRMLRKTQTAATFNNTWQAYQIVQNMSGYKPRLLKGVYLKDGTVASGEVQRHERWQEYFAELFGAEIVNDLDALMKPVVAKISDHGLRPTINDILRIFAKMGDK